jgi:halocyanin-like protein
VAVASLALVVVLAGCTTSAAPADDPLGLAVEPDYGDWFDGVGNYDGTVDLRGQDRVTVRVGVDANMGAFGFGPAAIAVSPGTTVVWEWTGRGGDHNVVAENGAFDSVDLVRTEGHTFAYTFDEPGVYAYVCDPHAGLGMRGAVVVAVGEAGS